MNESRNRFSSALRKSAKWILLAAILGFLAYRMKFAPTPVMAQAVKTGPIVAEAMGTGTLEARIKTTISPRIQERLAEVLVDQNDSVKTGQLLARLDDGELKRQVEVAEATLAAARASLKRVKTDEARARAVENQAQLNHRRVSELMATKVSSPDELDKAVEALQVAEADVKRSQAAIGEAESQVETAEKNIAYQKERLTYTQILSPYDGLVVRRDRDPGGVVVPGGSLLQLISTNEIWVSAWVDETAMLATIIMALIIYTLTLDKIHDIAMLKLMGARNGVIVGLILQQALLIGALGYGLAYWLGTFAFPRFPRLVVIETPDLLSLAAIVLGISVLSSLLGIWKAMRVEPNKVLL